MALYGSGYTAPIGLNQGVINPIAPVVPGAVVPGVLGPAVVPGALVTPLGGVANIDPTDPFIQPGSIITPLSSTIIDPTAHVMTTTNYVPGL
ncbi:unnamed protein product [Adineta ricciae]|uniref:Uncharacterized protein n=1 Tax=Adineta ricciae TaxID=249248 RepID=A0A815B051_ADIRI|nr:unnamed protein product [Adineta ricciae]CAF1424483.1 unnamed protein product [Adineta ricciae]